VRRAGSLLLIGIAAYLIFAIYNLPAVYIDDYIGERIPGLSLSAVSGSVFKGRAGHVEYKNMALGDVSWHFRPLKLLIGRVEYFLDITTPAGHGNGTAGLSFSGNSYGRDIELVLLPGKIINLYAPLGFETSGKVDLQIEEIKFEKNFPRDLAGKAAWENAAFLAPLELVLGDTFMTLRSIENEIVGNIEGNDDYGISGEIAIAPGRLYRFDLLLIPEANASSETLQLLENTAIVEAGGRYRLRSSGQWQ